MIIQKDVKHVYINIRKISEDINNKVLNIHEDLELGRYFNNNENRNIWVPWTLWNISTFLRNEMNRTN